LGHKYTKKRTQQLPLEFCPVVSSEVTQQRRQERAESRGGEMAPPPRQRALLLFPLVVVLLLLAPPRADAWGKEGHIMVCKIAEVAPDSTSRHTQIEP
jgi:hypothetical protein